MKMHDCKSVLVDLDTWRRESEKGRKNVERGGITEACEGERSVKEVIYSVPCCLLGRLTEGRRGIDGMKGAGEIGMLSG